jgi:uncharacterized repeat protein (TIGR01451 family)
VSAPFLLAREVAPELTVRKTATPGQVLPGGTVTFAIEIENTGVGDADPVTVRDVLDDPNLGHTSPPRNLVCPPPGVGTIDTSGPDAVVTCAGMVAAGSGRPLRMTFDVDVDVPFVPGGGPPQVCNVATMIYQCNETASAAPPGVCVEVIGVPSCVVGSLTTRSLRAVKAGAEARFSWDSDPNAAFYHVNSVLAPADLLPPGPHRPPVVGGVGTAECEATAPALTCDDLDALAGPSLKLYQVLSACGPDGDDEGPI